MGIWQILDRTDLYTETEKGIIAYLQDHRQDLDGLTIGHLATETFSSNASIIRLCHKLGYQGFRDFRLALIKDLENQKFLDQTVDYSRPFEVEASSETALNNLFSLYKKSLNQVQSSLDIPALEAMADSVLASRRVFLFGYGDVKLTLHSFMNKLVKLGIFPILVTENDEELAILNHIQAQDMVLMVTYRGSYDLLENFTQVLRRRRVPMFTITANSESPLLPRSQASLVIPDLEKDDKIATFYSQLAFDYLLNALYTLTYQHLHKDD